MDRQSIPLGAAARPCCLVPNERRRTPTLHMILCRTLGLRHFECCLRGRALSLLIGRRHQRAGRVRKVGS